MTDPASGSAARNTKAIVAVAIAALLVIIGAVLTVVLVNRDDTAAPGAIAVTTGGAPATGVASSERTVAAAAAPTMDPDAEPAATGPRTIVVLDSGSDGTGAPTGVVSASTTGLEWVTVLTTPEQLTGIAAGDGLTVVVGGDAAAGGTVRSSVDGMTWTEPVAVSSALQKVAYGNGQWTAVGTETDASGAAVAVLHTSPDARTWTKASATTGISAASSVQIGSIAFGQGRWQISFTARSTDGRGFGDVGVVASTDNGQSWQPVVAPGAVPTGYGANPVSLELAFGADQWAMVGYTVDDVTADLGARLGQSGFSADGTTWVVQQPQLVDTYLDTLAWAGDGEWLARGGLKGGMTGAATDHAVYASSDLVNWTRLGGPGGQIADLTTTRWVALPSAAAAPSAPVVLSTCTDGGLSFTVSRETTFPTCEAMIAQWRSFMATGGTETRQGDWLCRLPSSAEAGTCALSDTDIFFTVGAAGSSAGAAVAGGAAPGAGPIAGDLGLSVPMSRPDCNGTGIVVLFSAVSPSSYAQEVQAALDANPGAGYLRTDQACSSLNPATAEGDAIYAVYRVAGTDQTGVCTAVNAAGGNAYGKWLDNTTSPESRIDC